MAMDPKLRGKTGRLSRDEDKQISDLLKKNVSPADIAKRLGRAYRQIADHCKNNYGIGEGLSEEEQEGAEFRRELRNRSEWRILQTQFNTEELEYYQELYGNFMRQFKEDIEPTEEFQIFSLIDKIIFINRFKTEQKVIQDEMVRIDAEITNLYLSEDSSDPEVRKKINALDNKKQGYMASAKHRADVYTLLEKQKDDILKQLKGTREQRMKNIESSKTSYVDLIKSLMDKKHREREGRHAAMRKLATDHAEEHLKTPHRYLDDGIDQPLLVPEDVRISASTPLEETLEMPQLVNSANPESGS